MKTYKKKYRNNNKTVKNTHLVKKNNTVIIKELIDKLTKPFASNDINKKDNYFDYINYVWLKNEKTKYEDKYLTQYDDFRVMQNDVFYKLHDIITKNINSKKTPIIIQMKKFFTSLQNLNTLTDSKHILKEFITKIDNIRQDKNNLWKMLAYVNIFEPISLWAPFCWSVEVSQSSSDYQCFIRSHNFEFIDLNVYYNDGTNIEYKKKYIETFKQFVNKSFNLLIDNNKFNPQDIIDIEIELLNSFTCEKNNSHTKINNIYYISKKESQEKYKFNWEVFAKELGFEKIPDHFFCTNISYLKCCSELLLKNWDNEKWRTYWIWLFARFIIRVTQKGYNEYYKFYGEFMRGQTIPLPPIVKNISYMIEPFNTFLSKEYYKNYSNEYYIEYAKSLAKNLQKSYINILGNNNLLSIKTKNAAIKKIENIIFSIGEIIYKLNDDPILNYNSNELIQNFFKFYNWKHTQEINHVGYNFKETYLLPRTDWYEYPLKNIGYSSFIVNAFYKPFENALFIPTGYLQKPFLDLDGRGLEYNLAYFGFTIAHEMSHALDSTGIYYDFNGNTFYDKYKNRKCILNNKELKNYNNVLFDIIKQYKEFYRRDEIPFTSVNIDDESISDISALDICTEYLREFQENNIIIAPIRALSYETFFTYFSIRMKSKLNKESLTSQLYTNPHGIDKYRANVTLSRSLIFRALYNIKKEDGMWWNNDTGVW